MIKNKIIGCYHQFKGCSEKKEKKRIKVKKILQIVSDDSSYKINCNIHKRLDKLTIKRFFLHSKEEQFADIIRSNDTPWSGCVQQGEIVINEKLYKFELNLGGFGYINSEDDKETYYSCYHIGCPELANFENSLENVPYDKWNVVPKKEIEIESNTSLTKEMLSYYITLYKEADYIGILKASSYKKVHCDSESGDCGIYKAEVLQTFKGDKKLKNIIFNDDLTNTPDVYANKAIYILHKHKKMYYQDEFIQLVPTKRLIDFFVKLSKNRVAINNEIYKSLYSFCKATGIKESKIRALNLWINKEATNIPPNAEIFFPILDREENK